MTFSQKLLMEKLSAYVFEKKLLIEKIFTVIEKIFTAMEKLFAMVLEKNYQ